MMEVAWPWLSHEIDKPVSGALSHHQYLNIRGLNCDYHDSKIKSRNTNHQYLNMRVFNCDYHDNKIKSKNTNYKLGSTIHNSPFLSKLY